MSKQTHRLLNGRGNTKVTCLTKYKGYFKYQHKYKVYFKYICYLIKMAAQIQRLLQINGNWCFFHFIDLIYGERKHYVLSSKLFPFLKVHPNFCGTNYDLSSNTTQPLVFKVIEYGFEIFQTVLSLNCKIIQLKTLDLVIHLSLNSNKAPNLFSAICSEINAVSNTNLILL